MTNSTLKATFHAVADIGIERYSMALFLDPSANFKLPSSIMEGNQDEKLTE